VPPYRLHRWSSSPGLNEMALNVRDGSTRASAGAARTVTSENECLTNGPGGKPAPAQEVCLRHGRVRGVSSAGFKMTFPFCPGASVPGRAANVSM